MSESFPKWVRTAVGAAFPALDAALNGRRETRPELAAVVVLKPNGEHKVFVGPRADVRHALVHGSRCPPGAIDWFDKAPGPHGLLVFVSDARNARWGVGFVDLMPGQKLTTTHVGAA